MRLLTIVSWPFIQDLSNGNVLVFVLLAAAWAIQGSRVAQIAFLALTLLIPRPLMLPVAVYLLLTNRELRVPFALGALLSLLLLVALDPGFHWLAKLASSGGDVGNTYNFGPSALMGLAWIPIGVVLAAFLTWRGRLGWASLAISPYWLAYYWMLPILDLLPGQLRALSGAPQSSSPRPRSSGAAPASGS